MTYLVKRNTINKKAHIWNPEKKDSYCRMYSTGGLGDKKKLELVEGINRSVCKNCIEKYTVIHGEKPKIYINQSKLKL